MAQESIYTGPASVIVFLGFGLDSAQIIVLFLMEKVKLRALDKD